MKEIRDLLHTFARRRGEPMALATLVQSRGSSYRKPGARMLVTSDGYAVGSLSGGCLEQEIAEHARAVLQNNQSLLLTVDTRARFGCHGAIDIFIEKVSAAFLEGLEQAAQQRRRCQVVTVFRGEATGSRLDETAETSDHAFVQTIEPPIRLVIVGHGPDAAPMESLAKVLGWDVECAMGTIDLPRHLDERTAVVIGTHNYGRDFSVLRALAEKSATYIGLIGSRRRRDQLLGDLRDIGVNFGDNLFGPAGLDIGAESPEQIALAVVAEIQSVFAGGDASSLRQKGAKVHAVSTPPARSRQPVAVR